MTWGRNQFGQLGNSYAAALIPTMVGTDMLWDQLSTGANFSIATKQDGSLWLWGNNNHGQLGNGTTISSAVPFQLVGANNWHTILAGYEHALTYDQSDQLSIWGLNYWGEVGDGTNIDKLNPTFIPCPNLETITSRSQSTSFLQQHSVPCSRFVFTNQTTKQLLVTRCCNLNVHPIPSTDVYWLRMLLQNV